MLRNQKIKKYIAFGGIISCVCACMMSQAKDIKLKSYSYSCNDITFGETINTRKGGKTEVVGSYYTLTDWTNAKHSDGYATIVGGTSKGNYSGSFTINLNQECERCIVYCCGYEVDSNINYYLAVNEDEVKVNSSEFETYTFENINSNKLIIRNNNQDKSGRLCISKIVFRLV